MKNDINAFGEIISYEKGLAICRKWHSYKKNINLFSLVKINTFNNHYLYGLIVDYSNIPLISDNVTFENFAPNLHFQSSEIEYLYKSYFKILILNNILEIAAYSKVYEIEEIDNIPNAYKVIDDFRKNIHAPFDFFKPIEQYRDEQIQEILK